MQPYAYILLLTIISCNNQQQKVGSSNVSDSTKPIPLTNTKNKNNKEICWAGALNNKTPTFIHYQLDSNVIIGEITYLNTREKLPIKLLGTIEEDKNYRLLEFDKTGNITGIITGKPVRNIFSGSWSSPKTNKELAMILYVKDTIINSPEIYPLHNEIFGSYHYQYGKTGSNGYFEMNKVGNDKIAFSIISLTDIDKGPNIAEVEKDTIPMNTNSFIYKIPGSDSCEFKTIFYKDFVYIDYTKGYCSGQFGLNATIDGIFMKIK